MKFVNVSLIEHGNMDTRGIRPLPFASVRYVQSTTDSVISDVTYYILSNFVKDLDDFLKNIIKND